MRAWLLGLLVLACSPTGDPSPTMPPAQPQQKHEPDAPRPTVTFGTSATVHVEVVDTEPKIERGLMYREFMAPDDGMLFLLDKEQVWSFWMRNTLISLDIIFITRQMTVAGISENAEPKTDTLRTVGVPSLYVVEVNGGWCAAHHVKAGDPVRFDGVISASRR